MTRPTLSELLAEDDRDRADLLRNKRRFGRWTWDPSDMTLAHDDGYWWDCDRFSSSAPVLDAIMQIAGKPGRFTAEDVGDFVRAINWLFEPQAVWCSFGGDAQCTARRALRRGDGGE